MFFCRSREIIRKSDKIQGGDLIRKWLCEHKEFLLYLIFGVLTTAVNYIIYFPCTHLFRLNWAAANVLAWIGAVLFAYLTNRIFVFRSRQKGIRGICTELGKFAGARLLSLGIEEGIMVLLIDLCGVDRWAPWGLPAGEFAAKTFAQIVVILSNYVFSKWFVFRKKKN